MRKHSRSSRSSWLEKSSIHSGERYPRPCPAPLTLSHRVTLGLHFPLPQGISLPNHTMDVILGGGAEGGGTADQFGGQQLQVSGWEEAV